MGILSFAATSKAASQKKSTIKALRLEVWEMVWRVWWRFGLLRRGNKNKDSNGEGVEGTSERGGKWRKVMDGVVALTAAMYWAVELAAYWAVAAEFVFCVLKTMIVTEKDG